jgi:NhaP-type Na+/H+ or K+/H+ antiporter
MRVALVFVAVLALALALTNPGFDRYERFVDDVVTQILIAEAGGLPGGDLISALGGPLASHLARRHTRRDNYIVFSVYRLDMAAVGLRGQEWRFLGIGTQFVELERPESLRD